MDNPSAGKSALGLDANVAAGLAYLPVCAINLIMSIIILATDKTNKLARFHAVQSLLLLGAVLIIGIPLYVIMFVGIFVDAAIGLPIISGLSSLVLLAFGLAVLVFLVLACIKAFSGQVYKIPVIGNMADKYSG
jgi:uncharacterized membrane protein